MISSDMTIKQIMQRLNETAEKIVFVVDDKERLLGTVTDGDVRRAIINDLKFSDSIDKIMQKNPKIAVLNQTDSTEHIRNMMVGNKLDRIPVLDDERRIVDVVLWVDIIRDREERATKNLLDNQVVVMAGGKGTRLDPFTKILPKPLIPIGNKPVIEIIMERFYHSGFHRFIYTLNYKRDYIKLFLKENDFPYEIDWVEEDDFLGTAGSLSLLEEKVKDTFFMTNCDSLLEVDFDKVLAWHKENKAAVTVVGCYNEIKIPFGVLTMSNGKLENISEKPVHDTIINTGVYVMEPHVVSYVPQNGKMDMNELLAKVIDREKVSVYPIYGGWLDIGQWEQYRETAKHLETDL